jgi:hypothetical protein
MRKFPSLCISIGIPVHIRALMCLFLLGSCVAGQTAVDMAGESHHKLLLENDRVRAFLVTLPPRQETPLVEHKHNFLTVTLNDSEIVIWNLGESPIMHFRFAQGDARFLMNGATRGMRNDSETEYRSVTVEFLDPKVTSYGHQPNTGQWTYGSGIIPPPVDPKAHFNDEMDAGQAVIHDTQLLSGEELRATDKDAHIAAELIIAVTDCDWRIPDKARIHKASGEVWWLPGGRSGRMFNDGASAARFVLIEFKESEQ